MTDKKITAPGIYAVRCVWAKADNIGAKETPAFQLLLVRHDDSEKVDATIWNTERTQDRLKRICQALKVEYPPQASDFVGKKANIDLNFRPNEKNPDRPWPDVRDWMPYDPAKEVTAELEPEAKEPPERDSGEEVPF